jgi:hypothetical protein
MCFAETVLRSQACRHYSGFLSGPCEVFEITGKTSFIDADGFEVLTVETMKITALF